MASRQLILLGILPSVVVHALLILGLSVTPEREEKIEEPECPTLGERCRARCEGRELVVPAACPSLDSCECEAVTVELALPASVLLPEPLEPPEPEPEPLPESDALAASEAPAPAPKRVGRGGEKAQRSRAKTIARVLGTTGDGEPGMIFDAIQSADGLDPLFSNALTQPGAAGLSTHSDSSLSGAVRRKLPGLRKCRADGSVRGTLSVSVSVDAHGKPTAVVVRRDTTDAPEVRACVVKRVEGWRMPSGQAGEVDFDVVFSSSD